MLVAALGGCGGHDDTTVTVRTVATLDTPRAAHTATALGNGRVLLAGGCVTDGCGTATDTTEVYDARTSRFSPGPRLTGPRDGHTATRLREGRVLLAGGFAGEGEGALATAEVCDAARCRPTGPLHTARGGHAAVRLRDGSVLVIGGDGALATTEVWADGRFRARPVAAPGPPGPHRDRAPGRPRARRRRLRRRRPGDRRRGAWRSTGSDPG